MIAAAESSLLKTLAFFVASDFAPTNEELWSNRLVADNDFSRDQWEEAWSRYEAMGRVDTSFDERRVRYRISLRKIKRAARLARLIRYLPSIKAVYLCNTLGWWNARETSDIDLLIIVGDGRLYATRLFIVSLLRLFRLRPGEGSRDPLCCSFWLSDKHLDLQSIAIADDVYLSFWLRRLIPVYDPEGMHAQLTAANRDLLQRFVDVNDLAMIPLVRRLGIGGQVLGGFFRILLGFIPEKFAQAVSKRLFFRLRVRSKEDTSVVMNAYMIKLHVSDRREEIREAWRRQWQDWLLTT